MSTAKQEVLPENTNLERFLAMSFVVIYVSVTHNSSFAYLACTLATAKTRSERK